MYTIGNDTSYGYEHTGIFFEYFCSKGSFALPRTHWRTCNAWIITEQVLRRPWSSLIRFAGTKNGHSDSAAEILLNVKIWDPSIMLQKEMTPIIISGKTPTQVNWGLWETSKWHSAGWELSIFQSHASEAMFCRLYNCPFFIKRLFANTDIPFVLCSHIHLPEWMNQGGWTGGQRWT